jgi:hypothetical protein
MRISLLVMLIHDFLIGAGTDVSGFLHGKEFTDTMTNGALESVKDALRSSYGVDLGFALQLLCGRGGALILDLVKLVLLFQELNVEGMHLALELLSSLRNTDDAVLGSSNESPANKEIFSESVSKATHGGHDRHRRSDRGDSSGSNS